jgi:hypothetical protein
MASYSKGRQIWALPDIALQRRPKSKLLWPQSKIGLRLFERVRTCVYRYSSIRHRHHPNYIMRDSVLDLCETPYVDVGWRSVPACKTSSNLAPLFTSLTDLDLEQQTFCILDRFRYTENLALKAVSSSASMYCRLLAQDMLCMPEIWPNWGNFGPPLVWLLCFYEPLDMSFMKTVDAVLMVNWHAEEVCCMSARTQLSRSALSSHVLRSRTLCASQYWRLLVYLLVNCYLIKYL